VRFFLVVVPFCGTAHGHQCPSCLPKGNPFVTHFLVSGIRVPLATTPDFCDNSNCRDDGGNIGTEVPFGPRPESAKKRLPLCIGVAIRKNRERKKLTIEQLAAKTGFYCKFLRGVETARVDAYLWQLRQISKGLDLTFGRVLAQAAKEARLDTGLLKIMQRLSAQKELS